MISTSGVIVLGAALGAVVFLFLTDYLFRKQEREAEQTLEETKEASAQVYLELNEEGDEANLAA